MLQIHIFEDISKSSCKCCMCNSLYQAPDCDHFLASMPNVS